MRKLKSPRVMVLFVALMAGILWASSAWAGGEPTPPGGEGSITVHKFHDANGNGVQDGGEGDIAGWRIRIYGSEAIIVAEGFTDASGWVTFTGLQLGLYGVWEEKRDCWDPTTPLLGLTEFEEGYYVAVELGSATTLTAGSGPPPLVTVDFGNVYTCGGEGCTPGYWKQPHHFDSWVGYAPIQPFEAVFDRLIEIRWGARGERPHSVTGPTLREALEANGGGINALARHAVAALLNAAHPDVSYPYTVADVIAMFQEAFDSDDFETTKDEFEEANEFGCPLN